MTKVIFWLKIINMYVKRTGSAYGQAFFGKI